MGVGAAYFDKLKPCQSGSAKNQKLAYFTSSLVLFCINNVNHIWAISWQNQQNECAPSKDSLQPPSLIRVFAVCMKKAWVLSYPLSLQWRLWSDWADLSVRWAHSFIMSRLIFGCLVCVCVCSNCAAHKWSVQHIIIYMHNQGGNTNFPTCAVDRVKFTEIKRKNENFCEILYTSGWGNWTFREKKIGIHRVISNPAHLCASH